MPQISSTVARCLDDLLAVQDDLTRHGAGHPATDAILSGLIAKHGRDTVQAAIAYSKANPPR
jgi:hypothetical protein